MREKIHPLGAFTLTELIISLSILATLVAMGNAGFSAARRQARQSEELAALRRVTQAYLNATTDQNGVYPLGFDQVRDASELDFVFPDGESLLSKSGNTLVVLQRIPWRLAPYIDWEVERSMVTWANRDLLEANPSGLYYALSIAPAFGLNAFCVGGYGGSSQSSDLATRASQVPQPSRMVAFTTASSFYVKPPNIRRSIFDSQNPGWTRQEDSQRATPEAAQQYGNIRFAYQGKALVSFLDGHQEVLSPSELRDCRLWSREAQALDAPDRAVER